MIIMIIMTNQILNPQSGNVKEKNWDLKLRSRKIPFVKIGNPNIPLRKLLNEGPNWSPRVTTTIKRLHSYPHNNVSENLMNLRPYKNFLSFNGPRGILLKTFTLKTAYCFLISASTFSAKLSTLSSYFS